MPGSDAIPDHPHASPHLDPRRETLRGWAALIALIYLPLALTVIGFITGGVLCRHGNVPIFDRLLGPLTLITFGWTYLGTILWYLTHAPAYILQAGPPHGRSPIARLIARWASALLPAAFGAALMAIGLWLLLGRRH
jgi:hypothetical protein